MSKHWFESIIGFCVLLLCISFSYRVYNLANGGYSASKTTTYTATFSNIDGIFIGSDVKIGGLKVGSVKHLRVDDNLMIVAKVDVYESVRIPTDSSIVVSSSNLLGGKFLEIKPGAESEEMQRGDSFSSTRSAINIEELISKFAFR